MKLEFRRSEMMEVLELMAEESMYHIISARSEESRIAWKHDLFGAYAFCLQMGWIDNRELIHMEDRFNNEVKSRMERVKEK